MWKRRKFWLGVIAVLVLGGASFYFYTQTLEAATAQEVEEAQLAGRDRWNEKRAAQASRQATNREQRPAARGVGSQNEGCGADHEEEDAKDESRHLAEDRVVPGPQSDLDV